MNSPGVLPINRQTLARWSSRGLWAVADQALFSLSNFLVNVLLGRWFAPAEYGAFVTAYTGFLLVGVAHTAFLSEPMLIFGAGKYGDRFSHYLTVLQRYHWKIMLVISAGLLVLAAGLALAQQELLGAAIAGSAVAAPFIFLSWLARRACYLVSRLRLAVWAGAVNLTLVVGGVIVLEWTQALTLFSVQILLAIAALLSTVIMLAPLGRVTSLPLDDAMKSAVWSEHWKYGRWSGAAAVLLWCQGSIYFFVLPIWGGLAATGTLRAILNLIMPILQSDLALVTLLAPVFVRSRRQAGRFARVVTWSATIFAAEALGYWIVLFLCGERLLEWIYGGAFRVDSRTLVALGSVPLLGGLSNVLATALRARERPDGVMWATVGALVVASTVGVAAVAIRGVEGAVIAMVCACLTYVVVSLCFLGQPDSMATATGWMAERSSRGQQL